MNYRVLKFPHLLLHKKEGEGEGTGFCNGTEVKQTVVSQNHFEIIGICTEKLAENEHIFSIVQSFIFWTDFDDMHSK